MAKGSSRIQLYSGRIVDPINPRVEDFDIIDVAHSATMQVRFTGHGDEFYSVGQHCVLASCWGDPDLELGIAYPLLMHDASEELLSDIASPIKYNSGLGDIYREIEDRLMAVISEAFGLDPEEWRNPAIKAVDVRMLRTELRDLGFEPGAKPGSPSQEEWDDLWGPWVGDVEPFPERILTPLYPPNAKAMFMQRYNEVRRDR